MAAYSKESIIDYNELPEINGILVDAIYAKRTTDDGSTDWHGDGDPDFYLCTSYFGTVDRKKYPTQMIKVLPEPFNTIFNGGLTHKGQPIRLKYLTYRTRSSGNGSFTDDSIDLCYTGRNNDHHVSIYRKVPFMQEKEHVFADKSEQAKLVLSTLKKKLKAPLAEPWEYIKYDSTPLRREGGLWYPDTLLESWRWCHGWPYIQNQYDKDRIRVWDGVMNRHLYMCRVSREEAEGPLDCVFMGDFESKHDGRPDCFINFAQWAHTKEDVPNQLIEFKSDGVDEKGYYKLSAMVNGKVQWTRRQFGTLWRVERISWVDDPTYKEPGLDTWEKAKKHYVIW